MNFMMTFRGVATAKRAPGRDGRAAGAANGDNDIVARKKKPRKYCGAFMLQRL
ncbi:hypothetical protein [Cupriavidus sp. D39]|uniref:hypothetical protein n=1 Tax=Cupriavidus sp. D39 TaxID=2997877 RepID=UPI00226D9259|nr:hypothetical protein [Cupriavidus sp. D39]MCY0856678.1 hypothetical protein [Cupriavidus sp. D39]